MSTEPPPPFRSESTTETNRSPVRRWRLVGLTVLVGLLFGATLTRFLEREPAPGSRSVADLVKAAQRKETWWDGFRSRVWPKLPSVIQDKCPGWVPVPAVKIRQEACAELANFGGAAAAATGVLTGALDDPHPEVQVEAIRALGAIGRPAEGAKTRLLAKLGEAGGQTDVAPFKATDFSDDSPAMVRRLNQPANPWTSYISGQLSAATRQALADYRESVSDSTALAGSLAVDFNRLVVGPLMYEPQRFAGVRWRPLTAQLLARHLRGVRVSRLNRLILEDALEMLPRQRAWVLSSKERLFEESVPIVAVGIGRMGAATVRYWPIRERAAEALAAVAPEDPAVVSALLDEYQAQDNEGAGRAIYELIRQSRRPVEIFEAAIQSAPPEARQDFVQALALASMPARQTTSVLTALADHPDDAIQFAAVGMLGRMGVEASAAVPALTNLLSRTLNDRRPASPNGLRRRIIVTLGAVGPGARAAIPLLEAEYRDAASLWRMEAALARWRIDGQCGDTLPILAEGLKDPDVSKRRRTLEWLTEVTRRHSEGLPYLIKGLGDPEDMVQVQAISALASFGNKAAAAVPALEELSARAKNFVSLPAQRAMETIQGEMRP